jgi:hypothetical protein
MIEAVTKFIPFLQNAELWVKVYFVIWLIGSVGLIPSILFAQQQSSTPPAQMVQPPPAGLSGAINPPFVSGRWPQTGELHYIDPAYSLLNDVEKFGPPPDGELIRVLQILFNGPFFRHTFEERPPTALYILCRTEQVLRTFSRDARDGNLRSALGNATTRVISLRDQISEANYGPGFDVVEHFQRQGDTLTSFVKALPANTGSRGDSEKQQSTLRQLRDFLRPFNIVN